MKTFVPGSMSKAYINELRKLQSAFLDSITEAPEETARRTAAYEAWLATTFKRENRLGKCC